MSFGAADAGYYELVGTQGTLRVDPAFDFGNGLKHELSIGGKKTSTDFAKRDQVAPELVYFSDCILEDTGPEPSGVEGLADIRVIRAIQESARTGRRIAVEPVMRRARPTATLEMNAPPHAMPKLIHAEPPSR